MNLVTGLWGMVSRRPFLLETREKSLTCFYPLECGRPWPGSFGTRLVLGYRRKCCVIHSVFHRPNLTLVLSF